jgi:hypothetical protein
MTNPPSSAPHVMLPVNAQQYGCGAVVQKIVCATCGHAGLVVLVSGSCGREHGTDDASVGPLNAQHRALLALSGDQTAGLTIQTPPPLGWPRVAGHWGFICDAGQVRS